MTSQKIRPYLFGTSCDGLGHHMAVTTHPYRFSGLPGNLVSWFLTLLVFSFVYFELFWTSGWALIRNGHLIEVRAY